MDINTKISESNLPERLRNILLGMEGVTKETTFHELDGISMRHFIKHRGVGFDTIKQFLNLAEKIDLTIKL